MQNWEARILAREHELGDKEADLVRQAASATELRAGLDAMKDLMSRRYRTAEGTDDLQAIEGIGPKIANLLANADIKSFERLSETSLGELTRILEAGGSRFGLADPMTWSEQAACLVNGDYVAFEAMKDELINGLPREAKQAAAAEAGPAVANVGAAADGVAASPAAASDAPSADAGDVTGEAPAQHDEAAEEEPDSKSGGSVSQASPAGNEMPRQAAGDAAERAIVSDGPLFEAAAYSSSASDSTGHGDDGRSGSR